MKESMAKGHPFWSCVDVRNDDVCWPWTGGRDKDGYGYQGRERAHRIAWECHHKKSLKRGEVVRHTCDNPPCCNPAHLRASSQLENVIDRVRKERSARGSKNGRAVLSDADALAIYNAAGSREDIARRFSISTHTVIDIKCGRTWGWLTKHPKSQVGNKRTVDITSGGRRT